MLSGFSGEVSSAHLRSYPPLEIVEGSRSAFRIPRTKKLHVEISASTQTIRNRDRGESSSQSSVEGTEVMDIESCGVVEDDKTKGEKMERASKTGTVLRKRLADISNLQQMNKQSNQEGKRQQAISLATNEYIDKLRKENMTLVKALADRNKVIEMSGMELQKLRINLQKVQQQNLQLAQANSQMLAELNSGKDRLKTLRHELGCKKNLLKAKKIVLESKAKTVTCFASQNQVGVDEHEEASENVDLGKGGDKPCNTERRQQSKENSLGCTKKENVNKKRLSSRRQSSRFKSEDVELEEDRLCLRSQSARFKREAIDLTEDGPRLRRQSARFETEESKLTDDRPRLRRQSASFKSDEPAASSNGPISPVRDGLVYESDSTLPDLLIPKEQEEGNKDPKEEAQESRRRLSSGRPMRRAAGKVQSYKEIPLKVKLRRPE